MLEVEHDRGGTGGVDVVAVVGIAHDADGFVARLGEEALEVTRNFSVTSGDDDSHRPSQRGSDSGRKVVGAVRHLWHSSR
jgi:hypothetical protein